jgi:hypothetical protein
MVFEPKMGAVGNKATDVEVAQAEAPHLKRVEWMSDPGLRKLYFWAFIICIASATTGYDGYASPRRQRFDLSFLLIQLDLC